MKDSISQIIGLYLMAWGYFKPTKTLAINVILAASLELCVELQTFLNHHFGTTNFCVQRLKLFNIYINECVLFIELGITG